MSAIKKTLLLIVILALSAFVLHQSYRITPGQNVGPFYIWQTTINKLKSDLGKGKLLTNTWQSKYNNEVNTYTVIAYSDKGLKFFLFFRS